MITKNISGQGSFGSENPNQGYPDFVKYPRIPYLDESQAIFGEGGCFEGYVFEKLDGGLSQVRNTIQGLVGGSKANYLIGPRTRIRWFPNFLKWMRSNFSLNNLPPDTILFGEWLVKKPEMDYDLSRLNKFYLIDLGFVENTGKLTIYDYEEAVHYLKSWGIEGIEILNPIRKGFVDKSFVQRTVRRRKSRLGAPKIEGVVLKDYGNEVFAKVLHHDYSEIRKQERDLEVRYINPRRVSKAVDRLVEEHGILHPGLEQVASEVAQDIKEETGTEFNPRAVLAVIGEMRYYNPDSVNH